MSRGSISISIDSAELKKALRQIGKWSDARKRSVRDAVAVTALNIDRKAKEAVSVDEGRLRASIAPEFTRDRLGASVGTDMTYAAAVEFGRKAGTMPPVAPIQAWAKRKGFEDPEGAGWAIAKIIKKKGTKARPFLAPAAESERRAYIRRIKKALTSTERVR